MTSSSNFASLANRQAMITGASSGIGAAIALEFASAGCDVILHCRQSITQVEKIATRVREMGRTASVVTADIGSESGREKLVNFVTESFPAASIWVNNAGVDLLTGELAKLNYAQKLKLLLDIDVTGTMELSRGIVEHWQTNHAKNTSLVNIGWDQADRGMEGDSGELFAAAKNAVMGFTRSLAVSVAPDIRVNCIAPGWIKTAWGETASDLWQDRVIRETPLARWGTPEDIAKTARFLVSDEAAFLTGQIVNVNGGAVR